MHGSPARAALALQSLLEPDADPERRFDALLLIAQCMTDIHILRLALGIPDD